MDAGESVVGEEVWCCVGQQEKQENVGVDDDVYY
jgi:hypothetical protein